MKKSAMLWTFLIVFLLTFCGEVFSFPLKAKDDMDREIEFLKKPERIVSLAPTHTEILFALGLGEKIVGVTDFCNYPGEAEEKRKIGGYITPDIENIIALKPDLILAFGTLQQTFVEKLEKRGQKVFYVYPRSVKDTLDLFERIGNITGTKANAEQLKNKVSEQIKCIQNKIGKIHNNKRPAVFRVMGLKPPGTIGSRSFQTDVFYYAGGKNVFADIEKDFFLMDIDAIIERNPDVIIVCGEDSEKVKQKLKNQEDWKALKAVEEDRIFVISCDLVCRPGPRIAETIEKIATYLYPDKFAVYPQRIISLGPSITEELYLLGVQDRLIGCTMYCKRPEEAEAKEKVATVIEVNLEKVISLKPDLVLATSLTDIKSVQKLKDLGIKIVSFSTPESFSQINDQFLALGRITEKQKEAVEIINMAKSKVAFIRNNVKDLQKPEVFFQVGAKPLFTITGDSFINDFIEFAGGINIADNLKSGFFSREEVLKADPDILIIVTMGIKGEKEKKIWEKFKTLKAVRNNNIFIIDSYKLCSPTPLSFVEALEEIAHILHPEDIGE